MKVTLFTTCIVDFMAMNVGKATVELLEGLGHEIDYPKNQTCCGQPTYNTGYVEKTKNTMKHFIETFEHAEVIVSPSGSCVSFVKEYPHIFADDKEWKERAEKVAAKTYEFDRDNIVAVGYSNGANIAASLLFHYQHALKGAILHHPMVPRKGIDLPNLTGKSVFIAAGTNDPICSPMESTELQSLLEKANAKVELHWENRGHQLTSQEVEAAANWYRQHFNTK